MHIFLKRTPIFLALAMVLGTLLLGGCFRKHIASAPPVKRPATQPAPEPTPPPEAAPAIIAEESAATTTTNPDVVEETYEVDAVDKKALPQVEESDLNDTVVEEPMGAEAQPETPMEQPVEAAPAMTESTPEPVTEPDAMAEPTTMADTEATPAAMPESAPAAEAEVAAESTAVAATEAVAEPTPEETAKPFVDPEEEVVELGDTPTVLSAGQKLYIQVGAFSKSANADAVMTDLVDQGYDVTTTMSTKGLYLVRVGGYADEATAGDTLGELKKKFPTSYLVKWDPAAK